MTDTIRLTEMLEHQHPRSRFADAGDVDVPYTRRMLAQAIQRNGNKHDGGALVMVIENDQNVIVAFVVGVLSRVYHIGTALCAQDMFLVAEDNAPPLSAMRLLSAFISWAERNPRVLEVQLSHSDALPEGERMAPVYERMGFARSGAVFRRDNPNFRKKAEQP
ncbi:hypothetical protein [Novosphingobium sp. FKTRR1]|uniref:hypothetical protein n=1 Tax=Novosphingobium sp. FKTRR1 TaxID=2879118 RepID=UPI001CF0708F|nr:hypothetical protein [Novosphingobium sp. FKTRR1]